MVSDSSDQNATKGLTRRQLLLVGAAGLAMGSGLLSVPKRYFRMPQQAQTFVAKVDRYELEIADVISRGFGELGITSKELKGMRILLKPNLVASACSRRRVRGDRKPAQAAPQARRPGGQRLQAVDHR